MNIYLIIAIITFIVFIAMIIGNLCNVYYKNYYTNLYKDFYTYNWNNNTTTIYLLIFRFNKYIHYKEFRHLKDLEKFYKEYKSNIIVLQSIKIKEYDIIQLE